MWTLLELLRLLLTSSKLLDYTANVILFLFRGAQRVTFLEQAHVTQKTNQVSKMDK